MKKSRLLATTTALCVATLGTTVFAEGQKVTSLGQSPITIGVNATYVDSSTTPTVYSVDVSWDSMEFTYTESGTNNWNPETYEYEFRSEASWSSEENEISVINHSNAQVNVKFEFTATEGNITGTFNVLNLDTSEKSENEMLLKSAEVGNHAYGALATLTLEGDLSDKNATQIGTVSVILTSVEENAME